MTARVVVDLLGGAGQRFRQAKPGGMAGGGMRGKAWVLAMDRINRAFGKTTINILMVPVIWNGMGVPLILTPPPPAGNSNTKARTGLRDRLRKAFPDLIIASLMGGRAFAGNAWTTYPRARKSPSVRGFGVSGEVEKRKKAGA